MAFLHPELTPILTTPTIESIDLLCSELYANLRPIHSNTGGGQHGHVGLIYSPAEYDILTGLNVPFTAPVWPGANPDHTNDTTAHQITETNRLFAQDMTVFISYNTLVTATKQLIIKAVKPVYFAVLVLPTSGLDSYSVHELINHLLTTYGTVTDTDITANRMRLGAAWNFDEPIEQLWTRTKQCLTFAETHHVPIAEREATTILFSVIEAAGLFTLHTEQWEMRPQAEKTMAILQEYFQNANNKRISKATTLTAGYHGAHAVTPIQPTTATTTATTTGTDNTGGGTTPSPDGSRMINVPKIAAIAFYCWSCGIGFSPKHHSGNCQDRKEGHKHAATLYNRQGGVDAYQAPMSGVRSRNRNNNHRNGNGTNNNTGNGNGNGNGNGTNNNTGNGSGNGNGNNNGNNPRGFNTTE